jgi:lipopolysaccharide export system permease protein
VASEYSGSCFWFRFYGEKNISMNLLQRYLLRQFLPVCLVALLFFVLMLELGDLFANLWKYISGNVSVVSILRLFWLYIPKCISFSLPIAVLFSASYTMGNMYARNELTSIFSSGYPLYLLIVPLLVAGLILSVGMFFFEDLVVIHSTMQKNALTRTVLKQEESTSNANIVVLSGSGTIVYTADFFQAKEKKLFSALIIKRSAKGSLEYVCRSPVLSWNGVEWIADSPVLWSFKDPSKVTVANGPPPFSMNENPETFRRNLTSVDELSVPDAKKFIATLRKSGLPFNEQLSNYYKRFAFPFTIFIVLFFSVSLGGRFRKNIMLMSLLISLSVGVLFYVTQMISMLFAKWEYISPLAGAWFPVLLFIISGFAILRKART